MDRDTVGSSEFGENRRGHGVGLVRHSRLPDGGDVIDVDA
jgi:hypothetical protein